MSHSIIRKLSFFAAMAACILSCIPVFILLVGAITGKYELMKCLGGIFQEQGDTYFFLFPSYPTLRGFIEVLLDKPDFYVVFWNSVKLTCLIILGQIFFSVPAAWGFSRWHGKLSSLLFYSYTILMLLPFQVTMLSNYIVINGMGILDTHAAVILPAVFSTFPVFIIYRSFIGIPEEVFEAFSLESGSRLKMFWDIGIPLAMPGIKAAVLLSVIEYWNMIEQPLLFLKTPSLWPFSIYIPGINYDNVQYIFVFSLIVLIPMILIVFWGRDEIKKAMLLFFAVMAGLTILSRIADSFMIPQVAVSPSEEMELKYQVEIEGRVVTEGKQAAYCRENLRIGDVFVEKNDIVEKGDLLFSIDMEDLTSKIKQMEQEIRKCDLQIADLENAYQEQVNLQNQSLRRAKEDYRAVLNITEKEVDTAYTEMENAKSELEQHDSLKPEEGNLENEKADGKSALEEWTQKREELEQTYYEKQKLYESAAASREESLKAAARQIEDAGMGVNKNNSATLQQMEKESLENSLQQLNDLREENGNVYSEFEGRILECSISTGSITTSEPVIILEDFSRPFQFEGFIGEKDRPFVEEGTECTLEMIQGDVSLDGVKISKVAEGEDGMYRVTAKVDSDSVYQTGSAVLSFTKSSRRYPKCIPLSALYSGNSGYYVIEIKEDETVLGAQLVAEYVPVTLIENNDEYAAVEGEVSGYSKIVVRASKTIKEGDRVRIMEE